MIESSVASSELQVVGGVGGSLAGTSSVRIDGLTRRQVALALFRSYKKWLSDHPSPLHREPWQDVERSLFANAFRRPGDPCAIDSALADMRVQIATDREYGPDEEIEAGEIRTIEFDRVHGDNGLAARAIALLRRNLELGVSDPTNTASLYHDEPVGAAAILVAVVAAVLLVGGIIWRFVG